MTFRRLWTEARKGKSIWRILVNAVLETWADDIHGIVLDLACGKMPSYRRVMGLMKNANIRLVGVDYKCEFSPDVVSDLKVGLPFRDSTADSVILSSFLYIVPHPKTLLQGVRCVLKPQGHLIMTVPLVFPHTPEPTDYWRFTEDSLRLLLKQAGFIEPIIIPVGGRWTSAAYLLTPFLRPAWLVAPLTYWLCLKLDTWIERHFANVPPCPIGYAVKAKVSV